MPSWFSEQLEVDVPSRHGYAARAILDDDERVAALLERGRQIALDLIEESDT